MTASAENELSDSSPSISPQSLGRFTIPNPSWDIKQIFDTSIKANPASVQPRITAPVRHPLDKIIRGDIIKIWVGPDEKLFKVHKDLLARQSYFPYLFDREALGTPGLPQHSHVLFDHYGNISLPDDDPDAFSRLVEFLYQRTIAIIGRQPWRADPDREVSLAVPLYLIAERLGLHLIMNRVIGEIQRLDQASELPPLSAEELEGVYENSEDGSKLWEYVIMGVASQILWGLKDDEWAQTFRELCYRNAEIGAEYFRIMFEYGPELSTCQAAFFPASEYFNVSSVERRYMPTAVDYGVGKVISKDVEVSQIVTENDIVPELKVEDDGETCLLLG